MERHHTEHKTTPPCCRDRPT